MPIQVTRRLPWAIALASVALWAATPGGWGRAVLEGATLTDVSGRFGQHVDARFSANSASTDDYSSVEAESHDGMAGATGDMAGCEPAEVAEVAEADGVAEASEASEATQQETPVNQATPEPTAAPPATSQTAAQATFRLCGAADEAAARAIEQLIAGRPFSATLAGLQDGCANLTIKVAPRPAGVTSTGRQSTSLTIGAGAQGPVSVRIASEDGATRASIGPAS
ncbi:MAG: hypothetical protein ACRDI2_09535 [Chloroflexota bacterium]